MRIEQAAAFFARPKGEKALLRVGRAEHEALKHSWFEDGGAARQVGDTRTLR